MTTSTIAENLRGQIASYLSGESSIWDLDTWVSHFALDLPETDSAFGLSREVFLLLAEYTAGHRLEEDVQNELRATIRDIPVYIGGTFKATGFASSGPNSTTWLSPWVAGMASPVRFGIPTVVASS